ncbi:hypothetical protein FSP39_009863 [Pinctada imbricata]|uniref:Fibrinogen C-terminal domain-containing protein n=1 Tax=Pinctada imbricata TaxID=66713 RepID=A0AA88XUZ3_PINIB|nr:hypothetical protein FSP39_009863 [Pinctada imbricata]
MDQNARFGYLTLVSDPHESNEELCDIRKWYLKHTAEGTFDGDISPEQLRIKNGIEDIMLRGQSDPTLRFVKCEVLQKFDGDLKGPVNKIDIQGNVEDKATVNDVVDSNPPQSADEEIPDESEVDETEMDDTEMMEEEETEEENNEEIIGNEDVSDSLSSNNEETRDVDRVLEDIIDGGQQNNDDVIIKNDITSHSEQALQEDLKNDDKEVREGKQEELQDNVNILEDKEPLRQVNFTDNAQSDYDVANIPKDDNVRSASGKLSKTAKPKRRKFKFGICRVKYSRQLDIFDIQNSGDETNVSQTNISDSLAQGRSYDICSGRMVMSPNYCLMQHMLDFSNNITKLDTNNNVDSSDILKESEKEDNSDVVSKDKSDSIKEDDEDAREIKLDKIKDEVDTENRNSKKKIVEYLDNNLSTDNELKPDTTKETAGEKNSFIDLENLEMIIASKTREYETKMQSLELVIMKLENQVLIEKLNKQNHTSTMSRLETQILRLENELLKMNQSYHDLRYDNEVLKKRQRKYLELGHSSMNSTQQDGEHHAVITEQQAKISHLSQLLHNQSTAINEMKSRSDYLEDQNRMLYQMVMNQTALMSQIMMRVQELSEQNIRQREEAQKLKEHLKSEVKTIIEERQDQKLKELSTRMLRDIDNIVSDKKLDRSSDSSSSPSENGKFTEVSIDRKMFTYEFQRKWCFGDSICVYNTIINSWCIPYSSVFWTECGAIYFRNRSVENEFGPFAKDAVTGEIHKEEATETHPRDLPDVITVSDKNNDGNDLNQYLDHPDSKDEQGKSDKQLKMEIDTTALEQSLSADKLAEEGNDQNKEKTTVPQHMEVVDHSKDKVQEQLKTSSGNLDDHMKETTSDENSSIRPLVPENDNNFAPETENQRPSQDGDIAGRQSSEDDFKTKQQGQENVQTMDQKSDNKEHTGITSSDQSGSKQQSDDKPGNQQMEAFQDINQQNALEVDRRQNEENQTGLEQLLVPTTQRQLTEGKQEVSDDKKADVSDEKQKDGDSKDKPNESETTMKADDKQSGETGQKPTKAVKQEAEGNKTDQQNKKATKTKSTKKGTQAVKRIPPKYAGTSTQTDPKDCYDLYLQGRKRNKVYRIKPYGLNKMIEVFCDMKNGGWTIIQKRQDGTTNFYREWSEYKKGFGGVYGEHWIGNDHLHRLTNQDEYTLRVDLMDWKRQTRHALYDYFLVEDETEGYRLHIDGYSGDAGDAMNKHNGHKFSTKDVDNDKVVKELGGSCAKRFSGAGWYYKCYQNNLNGKYYRNGDIPEKLYDGITWKPWTGPNYSLKQAEMKIRPRSAISNTQS